MHPGHQCYAATTLLSNSQDITAMLPIHHCNISGSLLVMFF